MGDLRVAQYLRCSRADLEALRPGGRDLTSAQPGPMLWPTDGPASRVR